MNPLPTQPPIKQTTKIGWWWLILLLVVISAIFGFLYPKLLHCIWYANEIRNYPMLYPVDNFINGSIFPDTIFIIIFLGLVCSLIIGFLKRFGSKRFIFLLVGLIGLLFLLSLSTGITRNKAYRASTIAHVVSMRSQAELYFREHDNYGITADNCNVPGSIFTSPDGLPELLSQVSKTYSSGSQVCYSTPNSWAVSVELPRGRPVGLLCPVNSSNFWCVDSDGNSFETSKHIHATSCQGLRVFRANESLVQ